MGLEELWKAILALAGIVGTLVAAGSAVFKLMNPYKRILARLDDLEDGQKKHAELLARDLTRFEVNDERDRVIMDTLFAMLEHARTNNSTGLMDAASKKMQAYLIHRK